MNTYGNNKHIGDSYLQTFDSYINTFVEYKQVLKNLIKMFIINLKQNENKIYYPLYDNYSGIMVYLHIDKCKHRINLPNLIFLNLITFLTLIISNLTNISWRELHIFRLSSIPRIS